MPGAFPRPALRGEGGRTATVRPGEGSEASGVPSAQEPPVSDLVADEGDLPRRQEDPEVEVGLGPDA